MDVDDYEEKEKVKGMINITNQTPRGRIKTFSFGTT